MLASITEKKSSLEEQARSLQERLDACIMHNVAQLQRVDNFICECKEMLGQLEKTFASLVEMLDFNSEVTLQRGGGSFSAWSYVMNKVKDRGSIDGVDKDEAFLRERHTNCKKCIGELKSKLTMAREWKRTHSSIVESCNSQRSNLLQICYGGTNLASDPALLSFESLDENSSHYDHRKCHDCMESHDVAKNCVETLKNLDKHEECISERYSFFCIFSNSHFS